MTGDELTTLLLRHGVEVMSIDIQWGPGQGPSYIVHCRDIAAAALSPEMLPSNVELIINSKDRQRVYGLTERMGETRSRTEARMEGRGNFVLTSTPPRTSDQQRQTITQPVRRNAVTVPSRRFDGPPAPARTAPPRRVNDAEVLARIQSHLEASPRRFHWFTDAELRALGKSACTPPWQRLECAIRDGSSPALVAQLLPSNVFLPLGDTTTGLWGSCEDEVFVASPPQQVDSTATAQQPPTIRRWDAADLRRAISSDYEIVAVTPMRANPQTTPKDGRYRVDVRLLETRGYHCSTTILPRGVCVRYDAADGGTTQTIHGENDSLVADLDDWTPTQQINEAELRALVLGLPNVLGISGHIERGSRQRDRYIVRVNLVDRDAPLDSALAPQIPGNVHIHCQGRGEGGMRGVRGTAATMYVPQQSGDHTQQHLQRRLDYDGLVALLRRHLGDDVRVTSIKAGREGHFDVEVAEWASGNKIKAEHLPQNVSLVAHGRSLVGTSSQVFDPGRRILVDKAPRYFDADGDTVTTPDKAPPWLHQMVAEVRAKSASWSREGRRVVLSFLMYFGHKLTEAQVQRARTKLSEHCYTTDRCAVTSTTAPAPRVPVCMVRAIREQRDLAVLMPSPEERDLTMEWQQMPANDWRNVVVDIVENGCVGLDDEAAAERASMYHTLMVEATQAKTELAEYVGQWCAQFQTRFALLEVDDADHTAKPRQPSAVLKRGKKPLTITTVMKFRELMASRMCPSTAEAAKQAGIDGEVAVYVLQRWCGGLGDEEALAVASSPQLGSSDKTTEAIDIIVEAMLHSRRPQLDVAAALPPSVLAVDEAAKKQRLVLAQVAEQLRQERQRRAAQVASQPVQELSRFALLDVDEATPDPTTVTNAWHAQQAQRNQPAKKIVAPPPQVPFAPPSQQHIDVPTPPHNGVDYVDATMISPQLQDLVKVAGLVSAAEQSGLMKRVYEN